jgi:hypothetical protein
MTQNSRRRSGSRPFDVGLRKSEEEAQQRRRAAAQEARDRTPEERAMFERQVSELAGLAAAGASKKTLANARKRFEEERDAVALAGAENDAEAQS